MTYKVGDIFDYPYPFAAAEWCNENGCEMKEVQSEVEERQGIRRYQIVASDTKSLLDSMRSSKKAQLDFEVDDYFESPKTYLQTSLGFKVNADRRSLAILNLLIAKAEAKVEVDKDNKVAFLDYENIIRRLSLDELKTIQVELAKEYSRVYDKVWLAKSQLKRARNKKEVEAVTWNFRNTKM